MIDFSIEWRVRQFLGVDEMLERLDTFFADVNRRLDNAGDVSDLSLEELEELERLYDEEIAVFKKLHEILDRMASDS